jgi:AraC-like DNA-binding protein
MNAPALVFGWRTAILGLVSGQVLLIAVALLQPARNRLANRLLAALLVVVVGLLTPFTIGFAGFYDVFPWLSFAPFAISLAVGPLVYGYAHALITGAPPPSFRWHLAPATGQFLYLSTCFALPLRVKNAWDGLTNAWADPLISSAAIASLATYSVLSRRLLRRYRAGLGNVVADESRYAARWLGHALAAVLLVVAVEVGYQSWEFVFGRLTYFSVLGLYLTLSALALYLAVEGWRHADLSFPRLAENGFAENATVDGVAGPTREKDWRQLGARWAARIRAEEWWRDPDLTLSSLAARLGVNTNHLSRGLNLGLGVNFATFINQLRAHAVADALNAGRREDLLTLALEAGFNSKASFNRAFRAVLGISPSAYRSRREVSNKEYLGALSKMRRADG